MFIFPINSSKQITRKDLLSMDVFGEKSSVISCIGQIAVLIIVILIQKQQNQVFTIVKLLFEVQPFKPYSSVHNGPKYHHVFDSPKLCRVPYYQTLYHS